jgi:MFS family permease
MEGIKEKFSRTSNYAWLVFIGCCMCSMSVGPLGIMIFGVYLIPLAEATGSDIVTTSVYMTINGWTMAVTAIFWGWLLSRTKNNSQNKIIYICIALFGLLGPWWNSFIAPQFGIFGYYVGAFIFALSGGSLIVMIPMTMISNWFSPKIRGKVFGIISAAGIIGALTIPPLFTSVIQTSGLSMTFFLHGAIMGIFTIIPCAFIFRKRDDDVLPWGVKSWDELESGTEGAHAAKYGFPVKKIFICFPFWLIIICQVTLTIHGALSNNAVGGAGYWLTLSGSPDAVNYAMIGALMMSVASVSDALAKLAAGAIIDKWGPGVGCSVFMVVPIAGMLVWCLIPASVVTLYVGAALFGCVTATIVVGKPLILRAMFGERSYPIVQSYTAAVNTFLSGIMSPFIAWVILVSNYSTGFLVGCAIWLVAAVLFFIAGRYVGKLEWVDVDGNPMPKGEVAAAK